MNKQPTELLVARYLQNKLNSEEAEAFELALMDSPELQAALETEIALQQAMLREDASHSINGDPEKPRTEKSNQWSSWALAASITLAVVSTTMYWKSSVEISALRSDIEELGRSIHPALIVTMDVMRSTGGTSPDVVIQRPNVQTMIILDIELAPTMKNQDALQLSLSDNEGNQISAWHSSRHLQGRVSAALSSENFPPGLYLLEMTSEGTEVVDQRLIEIR